MSTYYDTTGTVQLDQVAWKAFKNLTSRHWLAENGGAKDGAGKTDNIHSDLIAYSETAGGCTLRINGTYRNLGRHLIFDLTTAALLGDVSGEILEVCIDGENSLNVTSWENHNLWYGYCGCLNQTQFVQAQCIPFIPPRNEVAHMAFAAVNDDNGEINQRTIKVDVGNRLRECSCGGWDDFEDRPVCAHTKQVTADGMMFGSGTFLQLEQARRGELNGTNDTYLQAVAYLHSNSGQDSELTTENIDGGKARKTFARDDRLLGDTLDNWLTQFVYAWTNPTIDPKRLGEVTDETVARALLTRGTPSGGDGTTKLDAGSFLNMTGVFKNPKKVVEGDTWEALAGHPALTETLAVELDVTRVAPGALAQNLNISQQFVDQMDGYIISQQAPWRVAGKENAEIVKVLGETWEQTTTVALMRETVEQILHAGTTITRQ